MNQHQIYKYSSIQRTRFLSRFYQPGEDDKTGWSLDRLKQTSEKNGQTLLGGVSPVFAIYPGLL
jgi:hypothetical protein